MPCGSRPTRGRAATVFVLIIAQKLGNGLSFRKKKEIMSKNGSCIRVVLTKRKNLLLDLEAMDLEAMALGAAAAVLLNTWSYFVLISQAPQY